MNIILIGMPTAGKSTCGVILAKVLGYQFIDSDLIIQKEQNRLLKDIIKENGVDGFLKIENDVNASIQASNSVIATGGSVVYGKEAMEHLRSIGTVVYLKLSLDTILDRLKNVKQRGVVLREGQTVKDLYLERTPLYEKYADLIIESENLDVEGVVDQIMSALKK